MIHGLSVLLITIGAVSLVAGFLILGMLIFGIMKANDPREIWFFRFLYISMATFALGVCLQ